MHVKPCRPYHSRTAAGPLLRMPDGVSLFKVYYLSILGRDEPNRYEWAHCALRPADVESGLLRSGLEGVGFVTAFPHITKVFRFAPAMETVLHVRAFDTPSWTPLGLERDDGFVEFACYAEAALAAEEYGAWARARDVAEYAEFRSSFVDGPIVNRAKLAEYAAKGGVAR